MRTAFEREPSATPASGTWLLLAAAAVVVGCGREEPTARLVGTVTIGTGPPTEPLLVVIENRERGISAVAAVDAEGAFEVFTAPGRGVPEGSYRATLIDPPRPIGDIAEALKPGHAGRPESHGIAARLQATKKDVLTVEVRMPETRMEIVVPDDGENQGPGSAHDRAPTGRAR